VICRLTVVATATAATATAIAAVATSISTTTTTTTAAANAFFARTGFVDSEVTAVNILAVKGFDGGLRAFRGFHGDETKAARAAAEFVHDQIHIGDWAVFREQVLDLIFGGVVGKIPNIQSCAHDDSNCVS
jgi:hypothetical protein